MKRTLNTIIFLLAAITLMAQNSFIVADKNGNSQLVQSLIFQQDASNDRFSWNTNNDANGYQQARDIKDLLFIARANSTLTTGTVEEVTQMLEELSGTDKADAKAVAEALKGNSNVVDAYSADGNNLIVKKEKDAYVVYPMYEMKAPFSELPQLTSRESSVRKVPSPRRVLENSDKIAIFNFFDGMSGYEVQNTIVSSFITELAFAGYTAECYGHPAISGRDFSYANLNYVLEHSEDYAAIAIFSHGAKLDDGTSCFCTRELAGENESQISVDKKYYKSYSASIQTNNDCILYLGICDGLNEDNFKSTSPVVGYSGKTCMAQANYCMLLYLMLVEGYTLENAINALPKEPAPNQETKIYRSNKVNGRDLTLDSNSRITNYFHSVSLEYNLINNRTMGYILAGNYEGTLPYKGWGSAEFIPITGDYNWWQSYVKYRDVFLIKHFFVNEEDNFLIRLGFLEDMPEGVFICRIYGYENEVADDGLRNIKLVKPNTYRFLINSKNFKENSADEVLAEEDFYTPSILDASGQTISEISVPAGSTQTFAITGYSGHTFNVVTLNTEVVDVSVSGTTLTVKGLKEGKTHLGVYDEQNKQMAIAEVTVMAGGDTTYDGIITFADSKTKAICVEHWDTNGDGEFSKKEAAAVTDLERAFFESNITSFDELQYFTGLKTIGNYAFYYSHLSSVTIPNSVTSIGNFAFYGCLLTSIIIPNSVTTIGDNAFSETGSLTSLVIPNSVTAIGRYAFNGCFGLTSITIPASVTSIGEDAFGWCSYLASIVVEKGNTTYDSREDCNAIIHTATNELILGCKNTIIPNTVTRIGASAFLRCYDLTSITIPESVTSIGNNAFYTTSLTEVHTMIEQPFAIEDNVFQYYDNGQTFFTSASLYVPAGTKAKYEATAGWKEFKNIVEVGEEPGLTGDVDVVMERKYLVNTVNDYSSNSDFYIPTRFSVQEFWMNFSNDINVGIKYHNTYHWDGSYSNSHLGIFVVVSKKEGGEEEWYIAPLIKNEWVSEKIEIDGNGNIHYYMNGQDMGTHHFDLLTLSGAESLSVYASPYGWWYTHYHYMDDFKLAVGNTVISDNFDDGVLNTGIWQTPANPDGVREEDGILKMEQLRTDQDFTLHSKPVSFSGNSSFSGNIQFADAYVKAICVENWDTDGDGELSYDEAAAVKDLGEVFKDNSDITSFNELKHFSGLTSINANAFEWCQCLTSVTIPSFVTVIGKKAFCDCRQLTSVTLPNSLSIIEMGAFMGTSLTSVTIPESVTTIGDYAFEECNLKSVSIPESVTSIGAYAFYGCRSLTSVDISKSVTSIGKFAFKDCDELTSIVVARENSEYDSRNNCNAIINTANNELIVGCKKTIIPNSVITIGERAFESCDGLDNITIPESVKTISDYAFLYCRDLKSITIPNSVTSIGNMSFANCGGMTSVTIGSSVMSIGGLCFNECYSLTEIHSLIEEPFAIALVVFRDIQENVTLYVPKGTKAKYEATAGWKEFKNIVEME